LFVSITVTATDGMGRIGEAIINFEVYRDPILSGVPTY
jgi:hypothetical protein